MSQSLETRKNNEHRAALSIRNRVYNICAKVYMKLSRIAFRFSLRTPIYILFRRPIKFFMSKMVPNPVIVDGAFMYHNADYIGSGMLYMMAGDYEPATSACIKHLLQSEMTFVDVGAHIGYHTLKAARKVGARGRVYAFEPDPRNADLLQKSIVMNKFESCVQIVPVAITSTSQGRTVDLFLNESSGQNSIFGVPSQRHISVPATTLDQFFEKSGWPRVDLIKIDVEGAEQEVLSGMTQLSLRNPDLRLIVEYSPKALESRGIPALQMFSILNQLGFTRIIPLLDYGTSFTLNWSAKDGFQELIKQIGDSYFNLLCEKLPQI